MARIGPFPTPPDQKKPAGIFIHNDEGMNVDEKERQTAAPMSNQARGIIGAAQGYSEACRMSAREAIKEEVRRLRSKAGALEALARQIPDGFPTDADAALWQLFNDARR